MARNWPSFFFNPSIDEDAHSKTKRALEACGLSLAGAALGVLGGALLGGLGPVGLYLPVIIAVVLAAWYGGIGPALLCQVAGGAGVFGFLARPTLAAAYTRKEVYGLIGFLVVGKLALFLTATLRSRRDLKISEQMLRMIASATNDCIWDLEVGTNRVRRRGNLTGVFGRPEHMLEDSLEWWRNQIHPDESDAVWNSLQAALAGEEGRWEAEYRLQRADGSYVLIADRGKVLYDRTGRAVRMIGGMSDITAHRQAEKQLAYDALHDSMTGLPNRQFFRLRLEAALSEATEENQTAVLFLDLDRFKVINDSLGHRAGDKVLRGLAKRMELSLRNEEFAARFGGDEFTILLQKIPDESEAVEAAERILKALSFAFEYESHSFVVNASIGIALAADGVFPEEIVRHADIAMYRAKARGRSRYEIFESALDERTMRVLQVESEIRTSLANGNFRVYYQPIVALATGKISGFEALLRWQHPERGLLLPSEFLSVAEDSGLISELGQWALQTACQQLRAWRLAYPELQGLTVSVNLATRQFTDPKLVHQIRHILQQNQLEGSSLILELTENMILENDALAAARLEEFRDLGIRIAIDDFGKGQSSFGRLQDLPISILKIDGAFVQRIGEGKPEIVDAIIALARKLKLDVTAERVESWSEFEHLRREKCTNAQGSYFSNAVSSQEATEYLRGDSHEAIRPMLGKSAQHS